MGLLSRAIYLGFLFPLVMGFAGGAVVKAAVKEGRVRNPLLAAAFGLIAGILMFAAMHAVQYFSFRAEFRNYIVEEYGPLSQSELSQVDELIDLYLVEETQVSGFWGYMLLRAEDGVSIGRVSSSSRFNLGPFLSWIYWLAEIAVAAGIAAYGGWQAAGKPFCEACDQ